MRQIHTLSIVVSFVLVSVSACSKTLLYTEHVTGTVTLDGEPAPDIRVFFNPQESGIPAHGLTDANGKYVITAMQGGGQGRGTVEGDYSVTFSKVQTTLKNEEKGLYETKQLLPLLYQDPKQTPFHATVVKGRNEFNFELKSDPEIEYKPLPGTLSAPKETY